MNDENTPIFCRFWEIFDSINDGEVKSIFDQAAFYRNLCDNELAERWASKGLDKIRQILDK